MVSDSRSGGRIGGHRDGEWRLFEQKPKLEFRLQGIYGLELGIRIACLSPLVMNRSKDMNRGQVTT